MSRIRTIKPEFFLDDELAELPPLTRLLFIGLWTLADCEGRMEDRPKRIRAQILPFDDGDTNAMLQALHDAGFIIRYEISGSRFIQVRNFKKHQRLSGKEAEQESEYPPVTQDESNGEAMVKQRGSNGEAMVKQRGSNGEAVVAQEGKGREGKGKERKGIGKEGKREDAHARGNTPSIMSKDWQPSQDALDIIKNEGIDTEFAMSCVPEFRLYWMQRGEARPGFDAAFVNSVKRSWIVAKREKKRDDAPQRARPPGMTLGEWGNIQARRHMTDDMPAIQGGQHAH